MRSLDSSLSGKGAVSSTATLSPSHGHPRLLLLTLTSGYMAQGLAFTSLTSALPQIAQDMGARGEFVAQMMMALVALGILVGALTSGWILERAGTRRTFLGSMGALGTLGAGGLFLRDPTLLLATRFIVGFAAACLVTTCLWMISAEYDGHRRASVLGIANAAGSAVGLAGMLIGGFIARLAGWPMTFIVYPIFALIMCLLALLSLRQVRPPRTRGGQEAEPFFLRLLPSYLLTTWLFIVIFMGSTQYAFLLQDNGISDPAQRALIMAVTTVMSTLISFAYGAIQKKLGMSGTFLAGVTSATLALSIIALFRVGAADVIGSALLGCFVGLATPYVYHTVTERTGAAVRGRALGFVGAFSYLGAFLNPLLLAPLGHKVGLHQSFLVVAAVMALLGVMTLFGRSKRSGERLAAIGP